VKLWNKVLTPGEIEQLYYSNLYKHNITEWYFFTNRTGLSDGEYTYTACASDDAGNENCTETRTATVDTQPPVITISSPAAKTYIISTIYFNASLNEGGSWCGYSLDSEPNLTMSNTTATDFWEVNTSMTEGMHSVIFYCNDSLNNMGSASWTFGIDTIPPAISRSEMVTKMVAWR